MINVLFRADGNTEIGAGHIMRCLALAQAVQEKDGKAFFACTSLAPAFAEKLRQNNCEVCKLQSDSYSLEEAIKVTALAAQKDCSWVVIDGYNFSSEYIADLNAKTNVLCLDDEGKHKTYSANIILNQNPHADEKLYAGKTDATLLLGSRYSMLRSEYRKKEQPQFQENVQKLLVTLGGSDMNNLTPFVLDALKGLPEELEIIVLLGGASTNDDTVRAGAEQMPQKIQIYKNVEDMPSVLQNVDLAITAAGSTCYELCYMGIPSLCIIIADNQIGVAEGLAHAGAIVNLGWDTKLTQEALCTSVLSLMTDHAKRKQLHTHGQWIIDGRGSERVLDLMAGEGIVLRDAKEEDVKRIWEWANDPGVRSASFSPDPIPWEDHQKWFSAQLKSSTTHIYVAEDAKHTPRGQIRFYEEDNKTVIDISIDTTVRGKGYGTLLLEEGLYRFLSQHPEKTVHAYAKEENVGSQKTFEKCGFTNLGKEEKKGYSVYHFSYSR